MPNFNSLAPCGANPYTRPCLMSALVFQLTRPVWGEPRLQIRLAHTFYISTHSPRVGRTQSPALTKHTHPNFNSLAPCGANPLPYFIGYLPYSISTHSPRVGRTPALLVETNEYPDFNSLAPCGANQKVSELCPKLLKFQLTRPVWGEPRRQQVCVRILHYFNSLAPCGANLHCDLLALVQRPFQLTRPVWGEPQILINKTRMKKISTHSPRVGRTSHRC